MNKTIGFIGGKFLPLHFGHIFAILEAHKQVDKLYIILSSSENRDIKLCKQDGIKYMPADIRMSWLGETFNNIENIEIINIKDDQWDNNYDWAKGAKMIIKAIPEKITHIFSSEHSYTELFKKLYPSTKHIVLDSERKIIPISATEIRLNLFSNWEKLPNNVKAFFVKKVLITGTESVGKSILTTKLSKFFNTNFVHEIGKDYCERFKNHLTVSMFDSIAMEHYLLQEKLMPYSNKVMFIDSDAVITQYYLNMYTSKTSSLIDEIIKRQTFDLCLYLEPDVEWVSDGFRFKGNPDERNKNNKILKDMYTHQISKIPTTCIQGDYSNRFTVATQKVRNLLTNNKRKK